MAADDLRDKIQKLRESIHDEDSSVTHIHATSSKIVVQNVGAGNAKSGLDTTSLAPRSRRPLKVTLIEGGKIAAVVAGLAALAEALRRLLEALR